MQSLTLCTCGTYGRYIIYYLCRVAKIFAVLVYSLGSGRVTYAAICRCGRVRNYYYVHSIHAKNLQLWCLENYRTLQGRPQDGNAMGVYSHSANVQYVEERMHVSTTW